MTGRTLAGRAAACGAVAMLVLAGWMRQQEPVQAAAQTVAASDVQLTGVALGASIYQSDCAPCHQANRAGSAPEFPSLIGVSKRFKDQELTDIVQQGLPRMLAFPDLKQDEVAALVLYLKTPELVAK